MKRSKSTQKPHTQSRRRSARLSDKFKKLPDELILVILSKLQDDTKTLLRCSSVCKHLQSVVSKIDTLSLRFSSDPAGKDCCCCDNNELHYHIPRSAIPTLMKLFANLKYLDIKLCVSSNTYHRPGNDHLFMSNAVIDSNGIHKYHVAFQIGLLSRIKTTTQSDVDQLALKFKLFDELIHSSAVLDPIFAFLKDFIPERPKMLASMVFSSANINGLSGNSVFMRKEQVVELAKLISQTTVCEKWLKKSENAVYWHNQDRVDDGNCDVEEKVWVVQQWKSRLAHGFHTSCPTERDVKELLGAFLDDDDDDDDDN